MTTEDDFQTALDAKPDDWQTRLVFADWLQERGDPRAAGYRALGVQRLCPYYETEDALCWWTTIEIGCVPPEGVHGNGCTLAPDWFGAIKGLGTDDEFKPYASRMQRCSRRRAENAAALGFTKLPPERQAELLIPPAAKRKRAKPRKKKAKKPRATAAPKSRARKPAARRTSKRGRK